MKIQIQGKKATAISKLLKAKNKRFAKLTRKEQRLAIAEDVIAQIRAKKFVAASTYFQLGKSTHAFDVFRTPDYENVEDAAEAGKDLSECIAQTGCTVCGIGSLFASAVLNNDRLKMSKVVDPGDPDYDAAAYIDIERDLEVSYLKKWFDADQLGLIEYYFEHHGSCHGPISDEDNNTKRLVMIMQNIVSNGGIFDPTKGRHSQKDSE